MSEPVTEPDTRPLKRNRAVHYRIFRWKTRGLTPAQLDEKAKRANVGVWEDTGETVQAGSGQKAVAVYRLRSGVPDQILTYQAVPSRRILHNRIAALKWKGLKTELQRSRFDRWKHELRCHPEPKAGIANARSWKSVPLIFGEWSGVEDGLNHLQGSDMGWSACGRKFNRFWCSTGKPTCDTCFSIYQSKINGKANSSQDLS